jgi:predicted SprT family Zn-dependent metalloprotease
MVPEEIKIMFRQEVLRIWGEKVNNYLEMEYEMDQDRKTRMAIGGFKTRPKAIGNSMIYMNKHHTLYVAPHTLKLSPETIRRVVRHEVIHIGYQLHNKEFFEMCQEYGASLTCSSDASNLPPFQAQVKEGSRYKTIRRFDKETEAVIFLKQYIRENGGRGRIKV